MCATREREEECKKEKQRVGESVRAKANDRASDNARARGRKGERA